jgi:DNA-binding transcriptional MerR regulator
MLTIGDLARATGCTVPTIRYYEEIGLLPPAMRRTSGHRVYDDTTRHRLTLIRRCRELGFPIDQIRAMVALAGDGGQPCIAARDMAQAHLDQVRGKLEEIRSLEASLQHFVARCTNSCAGGPVQDCCMIGDLTTTPPVLASVESRRSI